MLDIFNLAPKDNMDNSNIEKLMQLSDEEIKPLLLPLLKWIRDINWPIAQEVLPVLAQHQSILTPLILEVLRPEEKDDIWKYWIVSELLPLFSKENLQSILPAVKRLSENPTQSEIVEEVHLVAMDFLHGNT